MEKSTTNTVNNDAKTSHEHKSDGLSEQARYGNDFPRWEELTITNNFIFCSGQFYTELRHNYVIFLCPLDVFNKKI